MFSSDRNSHRDVFIQAWKKARAEQPLEPLERQIVGILRQHPEYQPFLEAEDSALERDFPPEQGEANPFLHLGLHMVILEQLSIDQPAGIRKLYRNLARRTGDAHEAEHRIMACLAESLWKLQHDRQPFNENDYLDCIRRAGRV
ncbi:DUF1841 family protein [Thiocystis violascens]|uniref:DUF1841 domain-containing protein n=1 Tax=Thiocystis violascens (strain ATCC 17096 / DSM 198 / 6111) TaxID=765911 RepID=I3YE23_THIV6|nr:DUF1841 family protein [Thiocystis violascens]AFL75241.1 protein of unknown function (DUF1841) [Thiocystis violascens DSM 198]